MDLTKEEEEDSFVADDVEVCGEEIFTRSLVGKLWTEDSFNSRIFKQFMVQAWRLKNPIEVQDLNNNLFVFRFSTKKDLESVLKNGPWSFDRNLVILKRVTGDEQPSEMPMHSGDLWARVYDLPLKLRSDAMAMKLGNSLGTFVEVDNKEGNRMGKFLRLKAIVDLRKPLKRGTMVKYQGKDLRIFFKYERLPTFCFLCGQIGHQIKDCEAMEGKDETDFEDIDEKELPFGKWLRASPLPKFSGEFKKENSSGSCSKNLFAGTSNIKEGYGEGRGKEVEVEQSVLPTPRLQPTVPVANIEVEKSHSAVESVVESLGNVAISVPELGKLDKGSRTKPKPNAKPGKTWVRQKVGKKTKGKEQTTTEGRKRQLVDVVISVGEPTDLSGEGQKRKLNGADVSCQIPEGVLDDQHLLSQ